MALNKTLLTSWPAYIGEQDFLLLALLICVLIVTYCWTVLGTRLKPVLCFSIGVFLFKTLFDQLIDQRLFPDLHLYMPYGLGIITAGLLEVGAFLLANRAVIFGIFLSGAIYPLLCLTRTSSFDFAGGSFSLLLISSTAIVIIFSLSMPKVTHSKLFEIVISAIAGGLGVFYLASFPVISSSWRLLGIYGLKAIVQTIQNNRLPGAICIAISGLVVQVMLYLILHQRTRSEPPKCYPDTEKGSSKYCQSSIAATDPPIACSHHFNY
jgi:hypothetical protein